MSPNTDDEFEEVLRPKTYDEFERYEDIDLGEEIDLEAMYNEIMGANKGPQKRENTTNPLNRGSQYKQFGSQGSGFIRANTNEWEYSMVENLPFWNTILGWGVTPGHVRGKIDEENRTQEPYSYEVRSQISKIKNWINESEEPQKSAWKEWYSHRIACYIREEKMKEPEYNGSGKGCLLPLVVIISIFFAVGAVIAQTIP